MCKAALITTLFLASLFGTGAVADVLNYPVASQQCTACRNACVNAGVVCKTKLCRRVGRRSAIASECNDATNNSAYVQGLQACVHAEDSCGKRCAHAMPFCLY
jgi:hypothetical protein